MTLELKPLGNACNLACTYCYQEPMRNAGNTKTNGAYDVDLMMEIADNAVKSGRYSTSTGYTLFGGEALLVPKQDLEIFFKNSFEKYGKSTIQSNGSLIDDDHIKLFKKYNVSVGLSIDGPNELNSLRVPAAKNKKVEDLTNGTTEAIYKLSKNKIPFSVIITVHKINGTGENLSRLMKWIRWLGDLGCKGGNVHMLEVDSEEASKYCMTQEENTNAFLTLASFFEKPENSDLNYYPFLEMEEMIRGRTEHAHCIFQSCNPLDTGAVYGIEGDGQLSNCGMVNKEGIEWTKSENTNILFRDLVLYQVEDKNGGCKGCPYFLLCNGYCPGSSQQSDWRNKTIYCKSLKKMFKYYEEKVEKEGATPFTKRPERKLLEELYFEELFKGSHRLQISDLYAKAREIQRSVQK